MAFAEATKDGLSGPNSFNTTHWSVVLRAGGVQSQQCVEALEQLCRTYWQPLYFFARRRGYTDADAKDLTQQFFSALLQRNDLAGVDPVRGRFRSFLLSAFTHFLANEYDRANAQKRGGGKTIISLDAVLDEQLKHFENSPDTPSGAAFDRHWAMTILAQALARLKTEFSAVPKANQFELLKGFLTADGASADYAGIAEKLAVAPASVPVLVHRLRGRYRELVREEVAQTLSNPGELEEEMRHLFQVLNT